MGRERRYRGELKDSYFDGYEYKGYKVKTKLVIEGKREYRPVKILGPENIYKMFKKLKESDRERFYSVLLDTKNKVIGVDLIGQGSINSALISPADIYKSALLASASSVIFVHSHPSGDFTPSEVDREITRRLKEVGELIGIDVLDYMIIGKDGFYSFSEGSNI